MQMKGAGIRDRNVVYWLRVPLVAIGTEISYHQSQVGHEADESRAKRAEEVMGYF